MNSFWRVMRIGLRYRLRYCFALITALACAALFGGNIGAVLPAMQLLLNEDSLQRQLAAKIELQQTAVDTRRIELESANHFGDHAAPSVGDTKQVPIEGARTKSARLALERADWRLAWSKQLLGLAERWLPQDRYQTLCMIVFFAFLGLVVNLSFEFANEILVQSVTELSLRDLRNQFFHHVMRRELAGFTHHGSSELMARFTNDMRQLTNGISVLLGDVVREPLKAASCIGIACWLNWRLSLVALGLVPLALVLIMRIGAYMKKATRKSLESMSVIYNILQESFQGIKIVKAFTMEPYERLRFLRETRSYYRKAMRIARLEALTSPLVGLVAVSALLSALLIGSYLVITGNTAIWGIPMTDERMDPESMFALFALLGGVGGPVRKLSNVYAKIQKSTAAADRIYTFMDEEPVVTTPLGAPSLARHAISIELEGVHFSYTDSRPILRDVSLKVSFGETIALVGSNGCGKSTLVSLLPRFYDPQRGRILIDGHDIRGVRRRSLRRQFGIVTQETILFNDTIFNNIAYGNRRAARPEVEAAARRAYAHGFIEELPECYDTIVGEKALKLSGGQRQRIALARAILRDPAILILDEATSALDVESESLIQMVLEEFTRDRTTILITHRLASLDLADRIVVMNDGRIEDVGTHTELVRRCAFYARLHEIHRAGGEVHAAA